MRGWLKLKEKLRYRMDCGRERPSGVPSSRRTYLGEAGRDCIDLTIILNGTVVTIRSPT